MWVAYLSTVDIHVLCILRALPCLSPLLTMHAVILTGDSTLLAGNRAVHQHPAGVGLALVHACPGGTVPYNQNYFSCLVSNILTCWYPHRLVSPTAFLWALVLKQMSLIPPVYILCTGKEC